MLVTNRGSDRAAPTLVGFCALMSILLTTGCSMLSDRWPEGKCTAQDRNLAARLNNLAEFELRTAGATLHDQGVSYGCTDSTNIPYASRLYSAGTVDEVADFYRRAVPAAGWKLEHADEINPGQRVYFGARLCFSRSIEGVIVFLSVGFPGGLDEGPEDILGPDPRDFDLFALADPEHTSRGC